MPVDRLWFIINVKTWTSSFLVVFNNLFDNLSQPQLLFGFRLSIVLMTELGLIGLNEKNWYFQYICKFDLVFEINMAMLDHLMGIY